MNSTDEIDRLLTYEVMHELGILPLNMAQCNVKKMLDSLDEIDATSARRKFRKLWRSLVAAANTTPENRKRMYGLGAPQPTVGQRTARKQIVLIHVRRIVAQRRKAIADSLNG